MGIIGSAIGGALGIGGAIFGGISASKAMKKAKKIVEGQVADNENWYNRRYNEDATQRAEARQMLRELDESVKRRNQQAAGVQAVMGGTDESAAAAKAANNQAIGDVMSSIAVNGERRKDQIEQQYRGTKLDLQDKLRNIEIGKANAVTSAIGGVANAAAGMSESF